LCSLTITIFVHFQLKKIVYYQWCCRFLEGKDKKNIFFTYNFLLNGSHLNSEYKSFLLLCNLLYCPEGCYVAIFDFCFWRMSFEGLKAFMDSTHKTIFKRLVLWIQLVRPKFSKKIWFNLSCQDLCTNLTSLKNVKLSLDLFEKNWKMFCLKLYTYVAKCTQKTVFRLKSHKLIFKSFSIQNKQAE
jgi:hypothetical protein